MPRTLQDYPFPSYLFPDTLLALNLSDDRINAIKRLLSAPPQPCVSPQNTMKLEYIVPWDNYSKKYPKVDFIVSQAVLEHIDNLSHFYNIMANILTKGGFTSHVIDFRSHEETILWNGHWALSDEKWARIRGNRPYLINREPLSTHISFLEDNGFIIVEKECYSETKLSSIVRKRLAPRFLNISDEDFRTSSCFILAKKL